MPEENYTPSVSQDPRHLSRDVNRDTEKGTEIGAAATLQRPSFRSGQTKLFSSALITKLGNDLTS